MARAAFVSVAVPCVRQTDDNPDGLPEAALEATIAQFRSDRPKWFARQAQVWYATHLG